ALHFATQRWQEATALQLLRAGASVHLHNSSGQSALDLTSDLRWRRRLEGVALALTRNERRAVRRPSQADPAVDRAAQNRRA
ncbi:MAG: hypothetical protein ACRETQ_10150, partial [Gammaproteobacteria bacterium]